MPLTTHGSPAIPTSPGYARTTYDASGKSATTRTGGGRGSLDYSQILNALAMNALRRRKGGPAVTPAARRPQLGTAAAKARVLESGDEKTMRDLAVRNAVADANFQQEQRGALTGPMPTKVTTIGGSTFNSPDDIHMTGLQRQVYLPQNAGQMAMPEDTGAADFERFAKASPGRMAPSTMYGQPEEATQQEALRQLLASLQG